METLRAQLLLLGTFLSVFLTNPVTVASEETAAHVNPASRAPAGNPTMAHHSHVTLHSTICFGRYLRRSPVQPPPPSRVTQTAHGFIQSGGTLHLFCLRVFNASHPHTIQISCQYSSKVTSISAKALLQAHAPSQAMTGILVLYRAAWAPH